jgi:hypothetical protein
MVYFKWLVLSFIVFSFTSYGCSKDEETVNTGSVARLQCTPVITQDTITHNSIKYIMVANSGVNNSIGIEVVNLSGVFASSYSMEFLQVNNGSNCYQDTISTELTPIMGKFFKFDNMPSWSIDTNTISKVHVKLDGTSYYLEDLYLDQ